MSINIVVLAAGAVFLYVLFLQWPVFGKNVVKSMLGAEQIIFTGFKLNAIPAKKRIEEVD